MRLLDIFSGIGGFSLGLERAGFQTVAFCEIDPFCRRVLAKHWPGVPCYDDVRTLTAGRLAADGIVVDAICGGFPCQDISSAGKGAGIEGERSGLWREYARLIRELRPLFAIIENVPALRTRGADRVLDDLEAAGYAARPLVVGAVHAGAPHKRQRVWIVANAASAGRGSREQPPSHVQLNGREPAQLRDGAREAASALAPVADAARVQPGRPEQRAERQRVGAGGQPGDVADADLARLALGAGVGGDARQERQAAVGGGRQEDQGRPLDDALRGRHGGEDGTVRAGRDGAVGAGWWLAEPGMGQRPDGLSPELDGGLNADAEGRDAHQPLPGLRIFDAAQDDERSPGGHGDLQAPQVLRPGMHGVSLCQRCALESSLSGAGEEVPWHLLRVVWGYETPVGASHRREYQGQLLRQYPDLVRELSYFPPPPCPACWANGSWENGLSRVAQGIPDRVNKLRALGNAVVPAVVEAIGRAVMRAAA